MWRRNRSRKTVQLPDEFIDRVAERFELDVYEASLEGDPDNVDVLMSLGCIYTKEGLVEKGLEIDKRLVKIDPQESIFHYNLACSHSLLGDLDHAFEALEQAIRLGYTDRDHLLRDKDLENLKGDRRYAKILEALERAREA